MSFSNINVSPYLTAAHDFADEARVIAQSFTGSDFSVSTKTDKSLVTKADIEIESKLRQRISARFPGHGVIGEEFPQDNQDSPYQWILDPIDGTEEFVHGVPTFGCIISLEYQSNPIVALIDHPALNMRLAALKSFGTFCNEKNFFIG